MMVNAPAVKSCNDDYFAMGEGTTEKILEFLVGINPMTSITPASLGLTIELQELILVSWVT